MAVPRSLRAVVVAAVVVAVVFSLGVGTTNALASAEASNRPRPTAPAEYSDLWAVHVPAGPHAARDVADSLGFHFHGQIGSLDNHFHFQHRCDQKTRADCLARFGHSAHRTGHLTNHTHVKWAEQQRVLKRAKRSQINIPDPLWPKQWHLHQSNGRHHNVKPVWEMGITGKGVVVTVVDDGIEHDHPDLHANYDPFASLDLNGHDADPYPNRADPINKHGTRCSGEIAAGKDHTCGVGIAYNCKIGGVRMLDGDVTDSVEASSLGLNPQHIDIYSNSWGPNDDGRTVEGPGNLAEAAMAKGIAVGRGGKGSIFLFASGNGGRSHDSCNVDGYANSIHTIAIGAISESNTAPWYGESCSAVMAVTYSSGSGGQRSITTTDLWGRCTSGHSGTSAAAPIAAGIYALVLEANPKLTWRDVQHVTVHGCVQIDKKNAGWAKNQAGHLYHHKYGFGRMDALKLVEVAQSWTNVAPALTYATPTASVKHVAKKGKPVHSKLVVTAANTRIRKLEHIEIIVDISCQRRGDIAVDLVCPSGTVSHVLGARVGDSYTIGLADWTMSSLVCWDESPVGTFELIVYSEQSFARTVTLNSWHLRLHGTQDYSVVECAVGKYYSSAKKQCVECHAECKDGCSGAGQTLCTACKHFQVGPTCVADCKAADMLPPLAGKTQCQPCHAECKDGCAGPGAKECTACKHVAEKLSDGIVECRAHCLTAEYPDASNECFPCHAECQGCTGPTQYDCVACKHFLASNTSADKGLGMSWCVTECPQGFFGDSKAGHKQCLPCDPECDSKGCTGPGPQQCRACLDFEILVPSLHHGLNGTLTECVAECPDNTRRVLDEATGFCECPAGFFTRPDTFICGACHQECDASGCTGPLNTDCSASCRDFQHGAECVPSCPLSTFESTDASLFKTHYPGLLPPSGVACLPCDLNCASGCAGPSAADCIDGDAGLCTSYRVNSTCVEECPPNYFLGLERECRACDPACRSCYGLGSSNCQRCAVAKLEEECVLECPAAFYLHASGVCRACSRQCTGGCSGPADTDCGLTNATQATDCKYYEHEGRCVRSCPTGFFGTDDNGHCRPCDAECADGCSGDGPHLCNTCLNVESSGVCVDACPGGTRASAARQCEACATPDCGEPCTKTCSGDQVLDATSCSCASPVCDGVMLGDSCLEACPLGTYLAEGMTCEPCDPECAGCSGPSDAECTACLTVRLNEHCVAECPATHFQDRETTVCVPCDPECADGCTGPSSKECARCQHALQDGACVSECPTGWFQDEATDVCSACSPECDAASGCKGQGAHQCNRCKRFVLNMVCVTRCPANFFPDASGSCQVCDKECAKGCTAAGPASCVDGECENYRDGDVCVAQCGANQYVSSMVCQACPSACGEGGCSGPLPSDCNAIKPTAAGPTHAASQPPGGEGNTKVDAEAPAETAGSGKGGSATTVAVVVLVLAAVVLAVMLVRRQIRGQRTAAYAAGRYSKVRFENPDSHDYADSYIDGSLDVHDELIQSRPVVELFDDGNDSEEDLII